MEIEETPVTESPEADQRVEIKTGDPRGDPTKVSPDSAAAEANEKIDAHGTMEFSSSVSDLVQAPQAAAAPQAPQMLAAEEPRPKAAKKGMINLGNLTPEQVQAVGVLVACAIAHSEPVQERLRTMIGSEAGTSWLLTSSALAALVYIIINRLKVFQ